MQTNTNGFKAGVLSALRLGVVIGLPSTLAAQDIGFQGPSLAGSGPTTGNPSVTESKPESKLWVHDGSWWGSLWSAGSQAFHIQRLNGATNDWVDTGVEVEARPDSHSDALSDGDKLYIVTHEFSQGGGDPGDDILVLRYSYGGAAYTLDSGFPVAIADSSTEVAVIEKDSTGRLWVVWIQDRRVHYSHTLGNDTSWSTPAILPGSTSNVTPDDICSIVHFNGNRIGVLWNDDNLDDFLFQVHVDGQAGTNWRPVEVALDGESDDHINLSADSAGRVFAVVKNDAEEIKLLVRSVNGNWSQFLVSEQGAGLTRATVLLDEDARRVHVFATVVDSIVEKTSSLDSIAFAPGSGTVVIHDEGGLLNNATTTKQNVDDETGIVILAANTSTTGNYWHHEVPGLPQGGLVLHAPTPGRAGRDNTFTVSGATPGSVVGFFVGMRAGSNVITHRLCPAGVEIEIGAPFRRLGVAHANSAGIATLKVFAPATTAGKSFFFQAVEPVSCRASSRIQEQF